MSQRSGCAGPDFHIPDEILSVMPTDPCEQLDLARKITSFFIDSRVSKLESEVFDRDGVINELEKRVSVLERAIGEKESQLRIALEESVKLSNERDSLAATTKKLGRDLMKLGTFIRQMIQSLSDENSSGQSDRHNTLHMAPPSKKQKKTTTTSKDEAAAGDSLKVSCKAEDFWRHHPNLKESMETGLFGPMSVAADWLSSSSLGREKAEELEQKWMSLREADVRSTSEEAEEEDDDDNDVEGLGSSRRCCKAEDENTV